MPTVFTELATEAADWAGYDGFAPDACLINRYERCGEAHEVKGYDALMRLHEADPSKLLSDKGYDSDDIRRDLIDQGIEPVIPPRSNLKQFRRIATRYEKTARAFVSMLCIAAARLRIKTVNMA